jgi:RHS repeat-associated protein
MNTVLCRYHYDPLDRLINTSPATQDTTMRFYNRSRLTTEIQGQIKRSYFQYDHLPLAQRQLQGQSSDTILLATDSQRSVLHAAASGQRTPMAYSPYGHRPAVNGHPILLGFNGEQPDPETGHYPLGNGYRAFNPVLMRFNSPDSLSPFDEGGLNAYAYALGNPANRIDPTGHFSFSARLLFGGISIVGGGLGLAGMITENEDLTSIGLGMAVGGLVGIGGVSIRSSMRTSRLTNIQPLFSEHHRVAIAEQRLFSKGGGRRLVIHGHGLEGRIDSYNPLDVADAVLDKYPKFNKQFKDVKLLSCFGADGGSSSAGAQLAFRLDKPVKAYKGVIRRSEILKPPSFPKSGRFSKSGLPVRELVEYEGVSYPHSPVISGSKIRAT